MSRKSPWDRKLLEDQVGYLPGEDTAYPEDFPEELGRRYGMPKNQTEFKKEHAAIQADMGLGAADFPLQVVTNPMKTDLGNSAIGSFNRDTGTINVLPEAHRGIQTSAHELAHGADLYDQGGFSRVPLYFPDYEQAAGHHKYYKNFDYDIQRQLKAQRMIEAGGKPDASAMQDMPWLNQVNPYSSNMLPSPWQFNQPGEDPMWLKNVILESDRPYNKENP